MIQLFEYQKPIKVCFSKKKYLLAIPKPPTQIVIRNFLIINDNRFLGSFKDYWRTKTHEFLKHVTNYTTI
jgi:hypothetical protein